MYITILTIGVELLDAAGDKAVAIPVAAEPFVLDLAISFFASLRYFIHPRKLATLFDCAQALHERVLVVSESQSVNIFQSFGPSFDTAFTRT